MQEPEEFCQKIDSKLKRSIIMTLAAVFAAACAASLLIYFFAPAADFMVNIFRGSFIRRGDDGSFLITSSQSDGSKSFSVVSSELTDGVFSAVILGKNDGMKDISLSSDDINFFITDVQNCQPPRICCASMDENVVIKAGSESLFSISAVVPQDISLDCCKASAIFSVGDYGGNFGIMLN